MGTLRELHELFAAVQEDAWQEMQKWLPRFMESVERSELQSVEITPSTIQDQENSRAGIPLNTSDVQSNIRHSSANRTGLDHFPIVFSLFQHSYLSRYWLIVYAYFFVFLFFLLTLHLSAFLFTICIPPPNSSNRNHK